MTQSQSELVDLIVHGPDEVTEIFLIDAHLQRIAMGIGRLEANVQPGIYKIRSRSGVTQNDKLIQVPQGQLTHAVSVSPVEFRSAAPIARTSTTHEYQTAPAVAESRKIHQRLGQGSQIYLFARESSEARAWASCDIALYDLWGSRLASIDAGFVDADARVAGINIELDPGTYAVRVSNSDLGVYEMYLTASADWQTQLFLSFDDFWSHGEGVRVPSIRNASLFMARTGRGFDPGKKTVRTSELARHALAQGRDVASMEVMNGLLSGKFEDPILGVIVSHLLLGRRRRNVELLETVCRNLGNMLGEHPDVKALEFTLGMQGNSESSIFSSPPSFRHSWDRIIKATRRRASLVAQEGIVAHIAADVVQAGLWLTRLVPEERKTETPSTTIAGATRLFQQFLEKDSAKLAKFSNAARSKQLSLSGVEKAVLSRALSLARSQDRGDFSQQAVAEFSSPRPRDALLKVDAPLYVVASAVSSLASKLSKEV